MAKAKAREMSIAAARAKASAERSYRKMVWTNNKICGQCAVGAKRIKTRRTEIIGQHKTATMQKQVRRSSYERHSHRSAMRKQSRTIQTMNRKLGKKSHSHAMVKSKPV